MESIGKSGLKSSFNGLTAPQAIVALERIIAAVCIDFQNQTGLRITNIHGPRIDLDTKRYEVNTAINISVAAPHAEHRNG